MDRRLALHGKLLQFTPNVYFQPPSNMMMSYPCIVYNKTPNDTHYAGNSAYLRIQGYRLMVIDSDPDSTIADDIEGQFANCIITNYYTVDELNHTTLSLYY